MAEGYTQSFVLIRYACNNSQSTVIEIDREEFQIGGQNNIKSISCSSGTFTFYDAYEQEVDYHGINDIYKFNENYLYLETILFNDSEMSEEELYNVPDWGGEIKAYYVGDIETGEDPAPGITITLSPSNLTLSVGETGVINASTYSSQSIIWSSNDIAIATVIGSGKSATVTAVSVGSTTITASIGTLIASCNITVSVPSDYTLKIYNDESKTDIIETITIPKDELINKHIYDTGVYKEINDKDGYYISEWKNLDTNDTIPDTQTMEGNLDIYPIYTELPTASYYSNVYLPNLTQRFPFGAADNSTLGDTGGTSIVKVPVPAHKHEFKMPSASGTDEGVTFSGGSLNANNTTYTTSSYTEFDGAPDASININPPHIQINFIIKYK